MATATWLNFFEHSNQLWTANCAWNTGTFKAMLTNTYTPAQTLANKSDITEIAAGNGYVAGGVALTNVAVTRTNQNTYITCDPIEFTASGGDIAPFRTLVIYNSTTNKLIGYFYPTPSTEINVTSGNKITFSFTDNKTLHYYTYSSGSRFGFNYAHEAAAKGLLNFSTHTFKAMLCTTINSYEGTSMSDVNEISSGNGYVAGGFTLSLTRAYTSYTYKVYSGSPGTSTLFTATGGSVSFNRIVIYDATLNIPLVEYQTGAKTIYPGQTLRITHYSVFSFYTS